MGKQSVRNTRAFVSKYWQPVILTFGTFLATSMLLRYLWREWTIVAMVGVAFYILGGRYVLPLRTTWLRAIAIGVVLAVVISTIEFFYNPGPGFE